MSAWIAANKARSWASLASKIDVTTQSLYEWRYGKCVPDARNRELLEAATGIRASVWATDAERVAAEEHAERLRRLRSERKHVRDITSVDARRNRGKRSVSPSRTAGQ